MFGYVYVGWAPAAAAAAPDNNTPTTAIIIICLLLAFLLIAGVAWYNTRKSAAAAVIKNRIIVQAQGGAETTQNYAAPADVPDSDYKQSSVFTRLQAISRSGDEEGYYAAPEVGGHGALAETEFAGDREDFDGDGPIMLNPVMSLEESARKSAGKSSNKRPGFAQAMYAPAGEVLGGGGDVEETDWDAFAQAVSSSGAETVVATVALPLGMGYYGDPALGYYVRECVAGGAAEAAGFLPGHRIITVNDQNVRSLTKRQVTALVKQAAEVNGGRCTFTLATDPAGLSAFLQATGKAPPVQSAPQPYPASMPETEPPLFPTAMPEVEPVSVAGLAQETFERTAQLPLGMALHGSSTMGYFIKATQPGGRADSAGFVTGMRVLAVNNTPVKWLEYQEVLDLVQMSNPERNGQCTLRMTADPGGLAAFLRTTGALASPEPTTPPPKMAELGKASAHTVNTGGLEWKKFSGVADSNGNAMTPAMPFSPARDPQATTVMVPIPMGMSIEGLPEAGWFVDQCEQGGAAAATGVIKPGQRVLSINGEDLDGMEHAEIMDMIASSGNTCTLTVLSDEAGLKAYYLANIIQQSHNR